MVSGGSFAHRPRQPWQAPSGLFGAAPAKRRHPFQTSQPPLRLSIPAKSSTVSSCPNDKTTTPCELSITGKPVLSDVFSDVQFNGCPGYSRRHLDPITYSDMRQPCLNLSICQGYCISGITCDKPHPNRSCPIVTCYKKIHAKGAQPGKPPSQPIAILSLPARSVSASTGIHRIAPLKLLSPSSRMKCPLGSCPSLASAAKDLLCPPLAPLCKSPDLRLLHMCLLLLSSHVYLVPLPLFCLLHCRLVLRGALPAFVGYSTFRPANSSSQLADNSVCFCSTQTALLLLRDDQF